MKKVVFFLFLTSFLHNQVLCGSKTNQIDQSGILHTEKTDLTMLLKQLEADLAQHHALSLELLRGYAYSKGKEDNQAYQSMIVTRGPVEDILEKSNSVLIKESDLEQLTIEQLDDLFNKAASLLERDIAVVKKHSEQAAYNAEQRERDMEATITVLSDQLDEEIRENDFLKKKNDLLNQKNEGFKQAYEKMETVAGKALAALRESTERESKRNRGLTDPDELEVDNLIKDSFDQMDDMLSQMNELTDKFVHFNKQREAIAQEYANAHEIILEFISTLQKHIERVQAVIKRGAGQSDELEKVLNNFLEAAQDTIAQIKELCNEFEKNNQKHETKDETTQTESNVLEAVSGEEPVITQEQRTDNNLATFMALSSEQESCLDRPASI